MLVGNDQPDAGQASLHKLSQELSPALS